MFHLRPEIKLDPRKRWALSDRIFFGYGACHILAGVFLLKSENRSYWAEKIEPSDGMNGNHIYVTDGLRIFDHRGILSKEKALLFHKRKWALREPGWDASIKVVDFDLLDTRELNKRKMKGPNQYLHNPIPRAVSFIEKYGRQIDLPINHEKIA